MASTLRAPVSILCAAAALLAAFAFPSPATAQEGRFATLKSGHVNMRQGPNKFYPVIWTYMRQNLPVEVIAESGEWLKVRDWENTEGWMHGQMVTDSRRTAMVTGIRPVPLHEEPSDSARMLARVEPRVIGKLIACEAEWCQVDFGEATGWMARQELWGIGTEEVF